MLERLPISLVCLSISCLSVLGCGGSDDGDDEVAGDTTSDTTEGDTTTGDTTTGDTTDATDDTTTDTTTDTTGDTTDATDDTTETTETTGNGDCMVWEITYDLTDSEFEISGTPFGAGDQVNVVQEPYDADDNVGPGNIVVRFQDVGGNPGGTAFIESYDMDINFVVSGPTMVTTDLVASAAPQECGLTSGTLNGTSVGWIPPAIADVHTMGTILCEGGLCGLGGLPDGMPVAVDNTEDQAVSPFEFNADFTTFSMDQTVIAMDDQSTTSWTFTGTETSRELIAAPACLCE